MEARSAFDEGKNEFKRRISRLKEFSKMTRRKADHRVDQFRKELNEAYRHLQKAFTEN